MLTVLSDLLPGALGVAFSPVPLLCILYTPKDRRFIFVLGWIAGIITLGGLAFLVASAQPAASSTTSNGLLQLVIGVLFVYLGVRQWQGRPRPGETPVRPKWAQHIAAAAPPAIFGTAALLSSLNPKNTPLVIASALEIDGAHLPGAQGWIAFGIFALLASISLILITLAPVLFGDRSSVILDSVAAWLDANGNIVMAVMFWYLGLTNIVKGMAAFLG